MPNSLRSADHFLNFCPDEYASDKGYTVMTAQLKENKSFTIEDESSACTIFISQSLSTAEHRTCLSHELGHCEYGGFYYRNSPFDLRSRKEYRADKWAFLRLAPPGKVKEAAKAGCSEVWEFSEWFGITDEYMARILSYYSQQSLI